MSNKGHSSSGDRSHGLSHEGLENRQSDSVDDDNEWDISSKYVEGKKVKKENIVKMIEDDKCPYCKYNLYKRLLNSFKKNHNTKIYLMACGHCNKIYRIIYKLSHMEKIDEKEGFKELFDFIRTV